MSGPRNPLAGASCWIVTDGKAGLDTHARGVAEALGLDYRMKRVAPAGVWRLLAPWGPVAPAERFAAADTPFAPPWPTVAIANGRAAIPYLRALRRRAGRATFTIVLQDPKTGLGAADLYCLPEHDTLRGANVITTLTSPHPFSPARLAALRADIPPEIARLASPRYAVLVGGRNGVYRFDSAAEARLADALVAIGRLGASFLVSTSRRTHASLIAAVEAALAPFPRVVWTGSGPNPYPSFLAHADAFVVTADSVNMAGEACATGKPVYVFAPSRGSAKFRRYHEALAATGATRPLPAQLAALETWSYEPIDSSPALAAEIARRYIIWRDRA